MSQTIYLVFGRPFTNPAEREFLGAYSTEALARKFVDAQPIERRPLLQISPSILDTDHPDDFWAKP